MLKREQPIETSASLEALLRPRSVAIIGASNEQGKIRGRLVANLIRTGFTGAVYPVNPAHTSVQGLPAYATTSAIRGPVDLALIAVAADHVPSVLDDCATAGVKAVIIHSAVRAQSSERGELLEAQIADFVRTTGARVLGPNSEGVYNVTDRVAASFAPVLDPEVMLQESTAERHDRVSLVSQSGAIAFALYARGVQQGLGFQHVVSSGDEADLECLELVDYIVAEGKSRAVLIFLEGFARPERFAAVAARAADLRVPLVVMKVGRSEAGRRAALFHTAHLAGRDPAYEAMFRRYGVTRTGDPEEMLSVAALFSKGRLPRGSRVVIATTTGGAGSWAADLCTASGLEVPPLGDDLRTRLEAVVPAYGSTINPIDVTGRALEDGGVGLVKILEEVEQSALLDAAIVITNLNTPWRLRVLAPLLGPTLQRMTKPVVFHSPSPALSGNLIRLAELGGVSAGLRACAVALSAALTYARFIEGWKVRTVPASGPGVAAGLLPRTEGPLSWQQARALLQAYEIRSPREALVSDVEQATSAAQAMGYPVVLKLVSPDIPHKTDANVIAFDLQDEHAVRHAYTTLTDNALAYKHDAHIEGVLVQHRLAPGREMAVGAIWDETFGPLLMLGFGGIYIDVLDDVVFAPVPVGDKEAREMISSLRGSRLLHGLRGQRRSDVCALSQLMTRLSRLVVDAGERLGGLDLNPVVVFPEGQGLAIPDVLMVAGGRGRHTGSTSHRGVAEQAKPTPPSVLRSAGAGGASTIGPSFKRVRTI